MDPNVYVISLDAVDLSLLPITPKRNDKIVPLWSGSNLDVRSDEYYEFKINTKEDILPEDKKTLFIEYVTCDICDIDVPKIYLSEHKNSFKHKFNKKIADVALKRLQLYMNRQDEESANNEKDPSKCYCPECSIIIDCKDEITHKKSIAHKQAVLLERFLRDFLQFYANDDIIEEQESLLCTSDDKIIEEQVLPLKSENFKQDITKSEESIGGDKNKKANNESFNGKPSLDMPVKSDYSLKTKHTVLDKNTPIDLIQTVDKENTNEIIQKEEQVPVKKPTINMKEYFKILSHKYAITMRYTVKNKEVLIKTIDGSKVRVSEDNFYGLLTVGCYQFCVICGVILEDVNDHILNDQHIKILGQPWKDKHCLRKISDFEDHCVICNTITKDSTSHITKAKHNENLRKSLIRDAVNDNNDDEVKSIAKSNVCSDANMSIVNNSKSPTESNNNKQNITALSNLKTNNNLDTPSTSDNGNSRSFCKFCNVWISVKNLKKHENTMKHNLNKMSDYHYLMKVIDSESLQCKICEDLVLNTIDDINRHFKSSSHVKKYNRLLKMNSVKKLKDLKYACGVCNDIFLHKNEYIHIESREHKAKFENVSNSDAEEIEITNTVIVGTERDLTVVENNDAKIGKDAGKSYANIVKDSNKSEKTDIRANGLVKMEQKVVSNSYFCKFCQVNVPNGANNIKIHNGGTRHLRNLVKTLK